MRAATILSLTSPSAAAVTAAAAAALSFDSFRLSVLKRHVSLPNHFLSPTVLLSPSSVNWPKQLRRPFDCRVAAFTGGCGTLLHDASAAAAVMAGAYTLVATFDYLTKRKLIQQRESPVGVVSLAMMCGGEGVADIMGRRFGSSKLPYNKQKIWAGSISMFVVGFLISTGWVF